MTRTGGRLVLDFQPGAWMSLEDVDFVCSLIRGLAEKAATAEGRPEQRLDMAWSPWEESEDGEWWTHVTPGGLIVLDPGSDAWEEDIFEQLDVLVSDVTKRAMSKVLALDLNERR